MKWLKCDQCGATDKSAAPYVGTSTNMLCEDCCERPHLTPDDARTMLSNAAMGKPTARAARLCRKCCPTGHGTKF